MEFTPFKKVPRLSREIVITEKIDGTNASITIVPLSEVIDADGTVIDPHVVSYSTDSDMAVLAGSRSKFVLPGKMTDNHGFAAWVHAHATELAAGLGYGTHFGEWWGHGIQRGYGLAKGEKRFSLFNTGRWVPHGAPLPEEASLKAHPPACCHVVPELYRGPMDTAVVLSVMDALKGLGSMAVEHSYMNPEGIMIFHTGSGQIYKKTYEGDAEGKDRAGIPRELIAA